MKFFLLLLFAAIVLVFGCEKKDTSEIPAVRDFDISRYCGKWYEIARLPNSFENGMSRVYTIYSPGKNGEVQVLNCGIKNGSEKSVSGVAKTVGTPGSGELKVSFFRPFYGAYRVIKIAPDYSYSVVCGSSRNYLWILARTQTLPQEQQKEIMEFLISHHFPVKKLIYSWQPNLTE